MRAPTSKDAFASEGGALHSFSQAQHLVLRTAADYGRFVDASITGAERERAINLLELMPPGMRGDFVEIHRDGTMTSNRADWRGMAKRQQLPGFGSPSRLPSRAITQMGRVRPMQYPPSGATGGPYLRYYSYQGINAAYGVAASPCDATFVNHGSTNYQNDAGYMYFNAWSGLSSVGDVTDAGIGADIYSTHTLPDGTTPSPTDVFAYVNSPSGGGWDPSNSGGFVNPYGHWSCGTPLVIMYGTLPPPNTGTSMLAVGPPDYDPTQFNLPPANVTLQNPSWTFFNTPSAIDPNQNPSPGDSNTGAVAGTYTSPNNETIPSNCMGCSVAMMYTIAEAFADGSCYGMCNSNGTADGKWYDVVMGELVSPCGPNSFGTSNPCTIEYDSAGSWVTGNGEGCSACNYYTQAPNGGDSYIVQGLSDLSYSSQDVHEAGIAQVLNLPTAPSSACTPDSSGYCDIQVSKIESGSCNTGMPSPHGGYIYDKAYDTEYYIFKKSVMLELQETATQNESIPARAPCSIKISWSPNNPATYYNDPNLP